MKRLAIPTDYNMFVVPTSHVCDATVSREKLTSDTCDCENVHSYIHVINLSLFLHNYLGDNKIYEVVCAKLQINFDNERVKNPRIWFFFNLIVSLFHSCLDFFSI